MPTRLGPRPLYSARQPSSTPIRLMRYTVSTNWYMVLLSAERGGIFLAAAASAARASAPRRWALCDVSFRNRSDWRRVLTTSNGDVTIAPAIPPSLALAMCAKVKAHDPAKECCHPCSCFFLRGNGTEALEPAALVLAADMRGGGGVLSVKTAEPDVMAGGEGSGRRGRSGSQVTRDEGQTESPR